MSGCKQKPPVIQQLMKLIIVILIILIVLKYFYQNSSLYYRKLFYLPFSLHLNEHDLYMIKGEEFHLFVYGINKWVSFSSTNFRVADVNFNGRVFAYNTGKAFIIAKVDGKKLKCRVHVIDINKHKIRLSVGETYRLKIRGTNSFVRWSSKDKDIAKVSMFGKVTAKQPGKTIIYAKVKGKKLKCEIIVE